ncbi:RNA methyltransferase [Nemania sp. NC0429]|nr:RNA methyltransferase [Nemania sp. NC0429]
MRFPTSSCLLRRHTVFFQALNTRRAAVPSRPASVLSAIHNGLRQSEKARPQGFDASSLDTTRPRRPRENSTTRSRREDWTPPTFKIKRGKKDVTDKGPQPQSRRARFNDPNNSFGKRSLVYQMKHGALRDQLASRYRGRGERGHGSSSPRRGPPERLTPADFMKDFTSSGGESSRGGLMGFKNERVSGGARSSSSPQRSTGWQSRTRSAKDARSLQDGHTRRADVSPFGNQQEELASTPSPNTRYASSTDRSERFDGTRYQDRRPESFANTSTPKHRDSSYKNRPDRVDRAQYQNRRHESFTDTSSPHARDASYRNRPERPDSTRYQRRGAFADTPSPQTRDESSADSPQRTDSARHQDEEDAERRQNSRTADDGPIRIYHTTAASQFLYGRSVVEAALKDSRRQLYKLYIYDGDDRKMIQRDDMLVRLAHMKKISVTKVSNSGLPMMQKMSHARPHNGCILEASPLPQLPLKALGPLSEDPEKPGFHVEIGYQSHEDAKINGTSDFVSYQLPKERKPFVLLLDGILDPGNLGAIIRTAAFMGVNAVAITKGSSATLTPVALKASAGASETMTLFLVDSTVDFITTSKSAGWLIYAAVPATKRAKGNSHLTVDRLETYDPLSSQPTVLVVGSEGEGLNKQVRRAVDMQVSIPGAPGSLLGGIDSLNVSVATGILCSAFLKNQTSDMIKVNEEPSESEDESDTRLW